MKRISCLNNYLYICLSDHHAVGSDMQQDEVNIALLRAGDENAWRDVFHRHYPAMCHVAEVYLHDNYLAEAVAENVMSHLWEIREQVQISVSLRSYLLRATRNRCLDYIKTRGRLERGLPGDTGLDTLSVWTEEHPFSRILEKEMEGYLLKAVENLPAENRTVFKKSRLEGLKYSEIAAELGISVNTVKYHMKRALAILRDEFGKYL